MTMEKIIAFGTGSTAEYFYQHMDPRKVEVLAFLNTVESGGTFHEYPVIGLDSLSHSSYDYILICSGYVDEMTKVLRQNGVPDEKITSFMYDNPSVFRQIQEMIDADVNRIYHRNVALQWLRKPEAVPDFFPAIVWDEELHLKSCEKDFVKEQTVRLIDAQTSQLEGNIAELGCFRGDFSVVLDQYFAGSDYYIFDSFQGFREDDVAKDKTLSNTSGELAKFHETSPELVLGRLKNVGRVRVKKGFFPDTFDLYDERFKFVCIDLNLYDPVYQALECFWPRLVSGGYIMVSDYFAPFYRGSHDAVDDWCRQHGVSVVPMADQYGSVIFVK